MTDIDGDGFTPTLLTSFDEVYAALGGPKMICALTGNSRASVWNWRKAQRFPARHYRLMCDALLEEGYTADQRLWAFSEFAIADDVAA